MNKLFGKGITKYVDKKQGKKQLSNTRKVVLALSILFGGILTGFSVGALGFSSILDIKLLVNVIASAVVTLHIAAILPFVGIVASIIVAITLTVVMAKTFVDFIKDPRAYLMKPINKINDVIDAKKEGKSSRRVIFEKAVAFTVIVPLVLVTIVGLGFAAHTCGKSLGDEMAAMGLNPAIAGYIGMAVGGVASFLGRVPFTYGNTAESSVVAVQKFYSPEELGKPKKIALLLAFFNTLFTGVFFFARNATKTPTNLTPMTPTPNGALSGTTAAREGTMELAHCYEKQKAPDLVGNYEKIDRFLNPAGNAATEDKASYVLEKFKQAHKASRNSRLFSNPLSPIKIASKNGILKLEYLNHYSYLHTNTRTHEILPVAPGKENAAPVAQSRENMSFVHHFKRAYLDDYNGKLFSNPKSKMWIMLKAGIIHDKGQVEVYAEKNPGGRTARVLAASAA